MKNRYPILPSSANLISLVEMTKRLRTDRSHLRKWLLKHNFKLSVSRTGSTNQLTICLTKSQFEEVQVLRKAQGFTV